MALMEGRLRRLEEDMGGGACPECGAGGSGPVRRFEVHDQEDCKVCGGPCRGAWTPCPTCGAAPVVINVVVEEEARE